MITTEDRCQSPIWPLYTPRRSIPRRYLRHMTPTWPPYTPRNRPSTRCNTGTRHSRGYLGRVPLRAHPEIQVEIRQPSPCNVREGERGTVRPPLGLVFLFSCQPFTCTLSPAPGRGLVGNRLRLDPNHAYPLILCPVFGVFFFLWASPHLQKIYLQKFWTTEEQRQPKNPDDNDVRSSGETPRKTKQKQKKKDPIRRAPPPNPRQGPQPLNPALFDRRSELGRRVG